MSKPSGCPWPEANFQGGRRMARGLAAIDGSRKESEFPLEFEEPHLITLGFAYEERARFAGGAYAPALD